jgi:hypothetical protein
VDHPTPDLLRRWRDGSLDPKEILAVSDHIEHCERCGSALADEALAASVAAAVGSQLDDAAVATALDHVSSEALERWVDGRSDEEESARVSAHLAECASCRAEADDLRTFAAGFTGTGAWRWPLAAAGVAAALLLILGTVGVLRRAPTPPDATTAAALPRPTPTAIVATAAPALVLRDGTGEVRLEADGSLSGLPERWRAEVAALLRHPEPALPSIALALAAWPDPERSGAQRSAGGREIRVLAPLSAVVLEEHPTFRWQGAPGASYRVEVFDSNFSPVASSPELRGEEWTAAGALPRGERLTWKLTVTSADGAVGSYPRRPHPPAVFALAPRATSERVAAAQATGSHLAAGLALWQAGRAADAAREWAELARQNPGSPEARRLAASAARNVERLQRRGAG